MNDLFTVVFFDGHGDIRSRCVPVSAIALDCFVEEFEQTVGIVQTITHQGRVLYCSAAQPADFA